MLNGHKVPKAVDFASDMYYRDLQRDIAPEFMSRFNHGVRDSRQPRLARRKKNLSEAIEDHASVDGPTRGLIGS